MSSDDSISGRVPRRKFLGGVASAGLIGAAGCADDANGGDDTGAVDDGTDDGTDDTGNGDDAMDYWPPEGGTVEVLIPVGPGDSRDVESRIISSMWERASDALTGERLRSVVTNNPGALGLLNHNRAWNAPNDGTVTNVAGSETLYMLQVADDNAEWNTQDFNAFDLTRQKPRGLQISQHSTSVEDHFDWDWDDLVANIDDLTLGASSPHQKISLLVLLEFADETDVDDISFVDFGSGSETRAEILAGNIDGYVGGYGTNIGRDDFYKTMFPFNSPDHYPVLLDQMIDQTEELHGNGDDLHHLGDFDLAEDTKTNTIEVANGATALYLPPGTSDDLVQMYSDMTDWGYGDEGEDRDETLYQEMTQARSILNEMTFSQITGSDAQDVVDAKAEVFVETQAVVDIVQENMG